VVVPLDFLTDGQVAACGRFDGVPSRADLERFFYQVAGIGAKVGAGRLTLQSDRVQTDVALLPKGRPDVPDSPREWGHSLVTEIRGVSLEPVQRLTDLRYLGRLLVGELLLGYPLPQP